MEENDEQGIIHYVRDYYLNTFINYSLGDISESDQFDLFYFSVLGNMYQIIQSEGDSHLANSIKGKSIESLKDIITIGYSQTHG